MKTKLSRHLAFTLIELMVAVGILVLVILSAGVIFQSASKAVGVSQASMELLTNVNAVQQQLDRDLQGINKNGFLVIRCGQFTDATVTPNVTRRCDQISFISNGSFPNRTGTTNATAFTDSTASPSAFVWWGQLAFQLPTPKGIAATTVTDPTSFHKSDETAKVDLAQVPNGVAESDYTLGRHTTLLVPDSSGASPVSPNGNSSVACYISSANLAAIDYSIANAAISGTTADITQSRVDLAATNIFEIQSLMKIALGVNVIDRTAVAASRFEADHYCYRYSALRSPYDSEVAFTTSVNPFVDGYFRMHPIALQGVSTFAVDWTDGTSYGQNTSDAMTSTTIASSNVSVDPATGAAGATDSVRWYGWHDGIIGNAKFGTGTFKAGIVDGFINQPVQSSGAIATLTSGTMHGDGYVAIFSSDNHARWPTALRFRYHVADPSGRIPGGRDFVQVINLPR